MRVVAIDKYIPQNRYSPTVRELAGILDIKSTSTIQSYLNRLKEKGYINNIPSTPRTITILKRA